MNTASRMIEIERAGNVLILTPQRDLGEMDYQEIDREQEELLHELAKDPAIKGVIVDFGRTDQFGSTTLGMLTRLWQEVQKRDCRLALCGISEHESDVLSFTGLAGFWRSFRSREEAVEAVNEVRAAMKKG
jgi:anti-anti-sigma factor